MNSMNDMKINKNGASGFEIGNTKSQIKRERRRKWCFTLNNYTVFEIMHLEKELNKHCSNFVFQEEKGIEGTEHLQGCFILIKSKELSWLKNNINNRAHFEKMNNEKASFEYCSKEETRNGKIYRKNKIIKLNRSFLDPTKSWSKYFDNYEEVSNHLGVKAKIIRLTKKLSVIEWDTMNDVLE